MPINRAAVVRLLVEMLEPYEGRVYDLVAAPAACLSSPNNLSKPTPAGTPQPQSLLSIFGQESNPMTACPREPAMHAFDTNL